MTVLRRVLTAWRTLRRASRRKGHCNHELRKQSEKPQMSWEELPGRYTRGDADTAADDTNAPATRCQDNPPAQVTVTAIRGCPEFRGTSVAAR
jgi:hypothetical protein